MNCITCNNKLTGKQKTFCSIKCKNSHHQSYASQKNRGKDRKTRLIKLFGGGCTKCGYKNNYSALHFHHIKDKLFKLDARNLSNRTWKVCITEAEKCILLCANCHAEVHNPSLDIGSEDGI